jgi:hypothetical protein
MVAFSISACFLDHLPDVAQLFGRQGESLFFQGVEEHLLDAVMHLGIPPDDFHHQSD